MSISKEPKKKEKSTRNSARTHNQTIFKYVSRFPVIQSRWRCRTNTGLNFHRKCFQLIVCRVFTFNKIVRLNWVVFYNGWLRPIKSLLTRAFAHSQRTFQVYAEIWLETRFYCCYCCYSAPRVFRSPIIIIFQKFYSSKSIFSINKLLLLGIGGIKWANRTHPHWQN